MAYEVTDSELIEACAIAASVVHGRHRHWSNVDRDDIAQELWIFANKKRVKISEWLDPEQDPSDVRRGQHALHKSLIRQGDRYCRTQKARLAGYETHDEAFYPMAVVEDLLPQAWEDPHEVTAPITEGPKQPSSPSEGGNYLVSLFDVRRALHALPDEERQILELRYSDNMPMGDIAEIIGVSRTTVERRVKRAVKSITVFLGGESPWR